MGVFFIAADAVTAELRQVIDDVPQVVAQRISCVTGDGDELESVIVELIAAYGAPLLPTADRVHTVTLHRLQQLLGDFAPGEGQVHTHVHVGDVSPDARIVN